MGSLSVPMGSGVLTLTLAVCACPTHQVEFHLFVACLKSLSALVRTLALVCCSERLHEWMLNVALAYKLES